VIRAILDAGDVKLDGLICPGHVSTITGSRVWEFIAKEYGIPCVVAGFEPVDILQGIDMLISQIESGQPKVEIAYSRGVTTQGNLRAGTVMEQVFEHCPARWRGIGDIPASGLKLNDKYRRFDAEQTFAIRVDEVGEQPGCICGEVLRGVKSPLDCQLFGKVCSPKHPVGPCMVSDEGCCSAQFKYGDIHG
jgi:hydrogenase expression/formation protein HypD